MLTVGCGCGKNGGKAPLTYQSFCRLVGKPPPPLNDPPAKIPGPAADLNNVDITAVVPSLEDLGYTDLNEVCMVTVPIVESGVNLLVVTL